MAHREQKVARFDQIRAIKTFEVHRVTKNKEKIKFKILQKFEPV